MPVKGLYGMGIKVSTFRSVHDLLAIKIKIMFLKLTIELNLNWSVQQIIDQVGMWNCRSPNKSLNTIFLSFGP